MKTKIGSVMHESGTTWTIHKPSPAGMEWETKNFKTEAAAEKFADTNGLKFFSRGYIFQGVTKNAKRKS